MFENGKESVLNDVFARLREIDNLFSVNLPASDISRINAAAGLEPVAVHPDVYYLIERSVFFAEISGGAFDPSVGPVVSLWDIAGKPRVPSKEEIDYALPLVNYRDIELNPGKKSVFLNRRGMALDLGAIAKGYAADEAAKIIIDAGVKRAIIDLGGNIVVIGENPNNRPWRVGIQDPNGERGEYIEVVEVGASGKQMSVVTSGVYERFFEEDGKRYHHIFSPETGHPVDNDLLSVTIIAESSALADALSTAVFVMGYEKGMEFLSYTPDIEAIFVLKDGGARTANNANLTRTNH